ncbi:MAG: dethiobiotin synthase [Parafilimonas sp.]|nr:dethiobiotin synthase [Parafilimonas sp.]
MNTIFITGIGTDVGKTVASAIAAEALQADYWKPVQAGFDNGTDAEFVRSVISNTNTVIHPETYKLKLAASPHIAAREENIEINLDKIFNDHQSIINNQISSVNRQLLSDNLIIEGAGGLLVPLNENEFVIDLIKKLNAKVILVSRNYLGSINHSLLTAQVCKQNNIDVLGWIFNDHYMNYENEIAEWTAYPKIASVPFSTKVDKAFVSEQATSMKPKLNALMNINN